MRKRIGSILLAACMLLPACTQFITGGVSSLESSTTESSFSSQYDSSSSSCSSFESSVESSSESLNSSFESSNESSWESSSDSSFESSSESSWESSSNSFESSSDSFESSNENSSNTDCENTHTDVNDDGRCDGCQISVTVTFDFLALNDLHGKFADTDTQPGVDELSTYIKETRAMNKNTVVLSSGDMWQGSSESNLTKGKIITEWMNEMDFVAMTLGNHEYDWGEEFVIENSELAQFPFLGINVYERDTNERVDYCQPSVVVEQSGVKIGIIGSIGDCYSSISSDKVQDIYFKTGSELRELVKAESIRLREEGADFIVYSTHEGYHYDSVLSNGYVDLIFEGHTHQDYVSQDSAGVYHLQNGGDNDGISHAQVTINYANGNATVNKAEFVSTSKYQNLSDDPIVEELMKKYEDEIALAGKVLGKNSKYRSSTEILNTCARLYYETALATWGDEYDIVLGGGFMSARFPYEVQAGTVTYGDLQNVLPFDNQLVLCSISGYYLRTKFFETTNNRYYIYYGDYGAQVKANIKNNETYYIVTDSYSSSYGPNHLTEIARFDETTFARDLLAAYIEQGGWAN